MNPAKQIIELFGGVRPLARALGLDPSTISRWQTPKKKRGTGGRIPAAHQGALLRLAKKRRIQISADQLIQK